MRCTTTLVLYTILGCALSAFAATSWTFTNTSPTQVQVFVVPANSPRLRITAVGASGGVHYSRTGDTYRGRGAMVSGIYYVQPGTNLYMIVGTTGGTSGWPGYNSDNGGGGGGGGSFLWNPSVSLANPMIAAGGGGGGSIESYSYTSIYAKGLDASFSTTGTNNWQGNGGAVAGVTAAAPGGKGWNDVVANPNPVPCSNYACASGGYGGGGGSNSWGALAGGGGGYAGGAGGVSNYPAGAGGASYVAGAQPTFAYPASYGDGYILIEVAPACDGDSDFDFSNVNCLCRSGFQGLGCLTDFTPCTQNVPKMNVTYPYPVIDTVRAPPQFMGDALVLSLRGPFVRSRRYTLLSFQGTNPAGSCNFAGVNSYWTKTFDSADTCQDILKLTLPWAQKTVCGFSQTDNGGLDVDVYKAKMQLQFAESMGTSYGGVVLTRTTTHSYDIYVYFPNKLTIVLNNTNVIATVQLDVALSNEQYDSLTNSLQLDFTTVTPWSGRLSPNMAATAPAGINVFSAPVEVIGTGCTVTSGSACQQQYHMAFQLAQNQSLCNFDGTYTLNSTMFACRLATGCSSAPVVITFLLQSGSVCASVAVRPTITGAMNAYSSPAAFGGDPVMNFKLGDRVYFLVTTNAGVNGNHVNISFNQITYTNTQDGTIELFNANNNLNSGRSAAGIKANVFVSNVNKYWYMYFSGEQFQIPFGTKMAFSFQASVTVTFIGGVTQKRTIEMVWEAEDAEYYPDGIRTDVGTMVELYKSEAAMNGQAMVEESASTLPETTANQIASGLTLANVAGIAIGGVVVGVVLVMGVVFSIYKKMQAQLVAAQKQSAQPLLA